MTEETREFETRQPDTKGEIEHDSLLSKRSSQESYNITKMVRSESHEEKKAEEIIEMNSDSNKSNKVFQTPTNLLSSSSSVNKDVDYMTPKSRHNLNLLFTESNESPFENKGLINYPYNLGVSPIDPLKLNQKSSINNLIHNSNPPMTHIPNFSNINPHYVFNNTDGNMSINIQHKYVYPKLTKEEFYSTGKFNRKIEFNTSISPQTSNENSKADKSNESNESSELVEEFSIQSQTDSVVKKPQPILGMSSQNMHKMSDINNQLNSQMYLPPFNYNRYENKSYAYTKMSQKEYEEKTEDELKKKKNFCNCKRSRCLKLYCECFANGEFCVNCNCQGCSNVIGNEEEKDDAFESIKEKNPVAMKLNSIKEQVKEEVTETKIGCNCTKSNCSKKYCECYKAGVECSETCRCRDCSNCSEKAKELKNKLINFHQQQPMLYNDDTLFYDYQTFNIEKNSVFINQGKLFHQKILIENPNDLLKITESFTNYNYNPSNSESINEKRKSCIPEKSDLCIVKQVEDRIFIELPKSILELHNNFQKISHTPISNKKRRRNKSIGSKNSDDISEYSHKFSRTACETNKKSSITKNIDTNNLQGKKLNLVGIKSRSHKLLD